MLPGISDHPQTKEQERNRFVGRHAGHDAMPKIGEGARGVADHHRTA